MSVEKSLLLIKPDGVLSNACEVARQAVEDSGLQVIEEKRVQITHQMVKQIYPERVNGRFWKEIKSYLVDKESVFILVEGENAIEKVKKLKGKTGKSGLRKMYAQNFIHNTFHCPDDVGQFEKEEEILKELEEEK